jgi:DNA transformation protein
VSPGKARELALEIAERIHMPPDVSVSRFFAGVALVADGVQFALVMKGSIYLRVDDRTRPVFEAMGASPFIYIGQSRVVTVASYYEAPGEAMNDSDALCHWASLAYHAALRVRKNGERRKRAKSNHRNAER